MPESGIQLSIIIPVYNIECYLPRCLDSILAQDFSAWEVIAVNDGSADGSGRILDEYAARDERIRPVHKANGGVSSARNAGLDLARGKYIGFVDGDDLVLPDMFAKLVSAAEDGGFDIVQCGYQNYYEDGSVSPAHAPLQEKEWPSAHAATVAFMNGEITPAVWTKIFRRENIGNLRFTNGLTIGEDLLFVFDACRRAGKVRQISYTGYSYFQRENSVTHETLKEKHFDRLKVVRRLLAENKDDPETYYLAARKAATSALSLTSLVLTQNKFRERLPELRTLALENRSLLLRSKKSSPRLRMQLIALWLAPAFYYKINVLRSRSLGR